MLERVTAILQDMPQLMQRQCEDMVLGRIRKKLQEAGNRGAGGGEYVMDDNGLLWVAPLGKVPRLAVPQSLVPEIMALAHSTYGRPGTARTTALISRRYCWPTLIRDVRDYVLSCGCRRRKRSASQRVAMLPARFLRPGEVLEVDIQDMGVKSDAGNKVVLVVVDKARDGGETGGMATRNTRRTVQDLASQMGRVCTAGTVDPSYHAGPTLTGEANCLPSFLRSWCTHAT